MALVTMEAPGGAGIQVLCPHCSRMYDSEEYPPRCKRCGSVMDNRVEKEIDPAKVPVVQG